MVVLSILIIAAYTAAVCVKQHGVPASISATFYKLEHPYWFMATMWLTAGLLMPPVLEASNPNTEFLAFLACAGMFFIGAAPNFRSEFEGKVHTPGAILCIAGSQIWAAMNCPLSLLVWLAYIVYTVVMMSRHVSERFIDDFLYTKPLFWIEITSFLTTYITLFVKS